MTHVLLINGHTPFPSSPGRLNAAYVERGTRLLEKAGSVVQTVNMALAWDIDAEVEKQLWADVILVQFPLNSFGPPWPLKRYLDEVYTAGMDGRLANGDGRTRQDPSRQYGSGGCMQDTRYMLCVTMNAPRTAFDDPAMTLLSGRSVDDLLAPLHINFSFFGLTSLPTFGAFDVNKNPRIEEDFQRYDAHLQEHLIAAAQL